MAKKIGVENYQQIMFQTPEELQFRSNICLDLSLSLAFASLVVAGAGISLTEHKNLHWSLRKHKSFKKESYLTSQLKQSLMMTYHHLMTILKFNNFEESRTMMSCRQFN